MASAGVVGQRWDYDEVPRNGDAADTHVHTHQDSKSHASSCLPWCGWVWLTLAGGLIAGLVLAQVAAGIQGSKVQRSQQKRQHDAAPGSQSTPVFEFAADRIAPDGMATLRSFCELAAQDQVFKQEGIIWKCSSKPFQCPKHVWLTYSPSLSNVYVNIRKSGSSSTQMYMRGGPPFVAAGSRLIEGGQEVAEELENNPNPAVFFWTIVRDPLSRFASGFSELEARFAKRVDNKEYKKQKPEFTRWYEEAKAQGLYVTQALGSPMRLRSFLRDLLSGRLTVFPHGDDNHVFLQCLNLCGLHKLGHDLSIVGRVENYNDTLVAVLSKANVANPTLAAESLLKTPSKNTATGNPVKRSFNFASSVMDAFRSDMIVRRLLCFYLAADYSCLNKLLPAKDSYKLPVECVQIFTELELMKQSR